MQKRTRVGLIGTSALLIASLFSGLTACSKPAPVPEQTAPTKQATMTINDINNEAKAAAYGPMTNKGYDGRYELTFDTVGSGYFAIIKYDVDGKEPYDDKKIAINLPIENATKEAIENAVVGNLSGLPVYTVPEPTKEETSTPSVISQTGPPVVCQTITTNAWSQLESEYYNFIRDVLSGRRQGSIGYAGPLAERDGRRAIQSAIERAMRDSGLSNRYRLGWSRENQPSCRDAKLEIYTDSWRNILWRTLYLDFISDTDRAWPYCNR